MLIDCDSFQIPGPPGHQPYPCVVGSPEYTAPEIDDFRRQFRSQDSDNFALAVLLEMYFQVRRACLMGKGLKRKFAQRSAALPSWGAPPDTTVDAL